MSDSSRETHPKLRSFSPAHWLREVVLPLARWRDEDDQRHVVAFLRTESRSAGLLLAAIVTAIVWAHRDAASAFSAVEERSGAAS